MGGSRATAAFFYWKGAGWGEVTIVLESITIVLVNLPILRYDIRIHCNPIIRRT